MCEVINIKNYKNADYVPIHRPTKWGNPYSHKDNTLAEFKVDTIEEAVEMYEKRLLENKELMNTLPELMYKKLGCFCVDTTKVKPKKIICHGQILKKYVDRLERLEERKNFI